MADNLDMSSVERPPLTIEAAGKIIKMSYGLEMDIRRMLPQPSTAMQLVMSDPYTQDYLVRRALTDRKAMITDEAQLITMDEIDISSEETEALLLWITEHCLYFFVKRASAMGELGTRYQTVLQGPTDSGSKSSALTTPSAGPLDASKETSTESTGPSPDAN